MHPLNTAWIRLIHHSFVPSLEILHLARLIDTLNVLFSLSLSLSQMTQRDAGLLQSSFTTASQQISGSGSSGSDSIKGQAKKYKVHPIF